MRQIAVPLIACLALAACGNSLGDVGRQGDGTVAPDGVEVAPAASPDESDDAPGFLGRLFGGGASASTAPERAGQSGGETAAGPADTEVSAGTVLPYGQVATVCGVTGRALGTEVGRAAGYRLYDTQPDSITPRTHYVTGLAGGCARQFTAALALFGDLPTHELIHYQDSNDNPYSATDIAYEEIKAGYCGVPSGQPCGARIDRLARSMAFITVYETFGTNPTWNEILLYGGDVVALSFRSS